MLSFLRLTTSLTSSRMSSRRLALFVFMTPSRLCTSLFLSSSILLPRLPSPFPLFPQRLQAASLPFETFSAARRVLSRHSEHVTTNDMLLGYAIMCLFGSMVGG